MSARVERRAGELLDRLVDRMTIEEFAEALDRCEAVREHAFEAAVHGQRSPSNAAFHIGEAYRLAAEWNAEHQAEAEEAERQLEEHIARTESTESLL